MMKARTWQVRSDILFSGAPINTFKLMALSAEQRKIISDELRAFLEKDLDVSLGTFEADDLADFVIEKIGPWLYNQGILDARAKLSSMVDGIVEELAMLEQASPLDR